MLSPATFLSTLPSGLRTPLIEEYSSIVQNYMEHRWSPSELSGGKFCEIVYTILDGYASGSFATTPNKPRNFVTACRALESKMSTPRSFQILIPRLLPTLYEIRNNRGVGHAGGDVDPNQMDASAVLAMASWVMAELIRVFHNVTIEEAQLAADSLVERPMPFVWSEGDIRRVLHTSLKLKEQIMLLVGSASASTKADDIFNWTEYGNRSHFNRVLKELHKNRFIEAKQTGEVVLLPPGSNYVTELIRKLG